MTCCLGYKEWTMGTYQSFFLNGYEMQDCISEVTSEYGPSGVQVPMLSGGSIYQRIPRSRNYPLDMIPRTFSINVTSACEEDYFRMNWIGALARERPVYFWYQELFEDVWPIRGTANLTWTMSRQTYFATIDYATYTPEAYIRSDDGTQNTVAFTVSQTSNDITLTTADLSANEGDYLVFRYHPLYLCTVESVSKAIPEPNGLDFTIGLQEYISAKPDGDPL